MSKLWRILRQCAPAVIVSLLTIPSSAQSNSELIQFLRTIAKANERQLAAVERGQPLALDLASENKTEIALIGVVRLNVTPDAFVSRYRNIARFKESEEVLQIGKFGQPPAESDLQGLTFSAGDLSDLQRCRPGKCSVKISTKMLTKLQEKIRGSQSAEQRAAAMRQILLDYLKEYLIEGDSALITYDDQKPQVSLAREFQELLAESKLLDTYGPEFREYLRQFPSPTLEPIEHFAYWSKEKAGFKAVTSLTHVIIYQKDVQGVPWYFIASKNLYSSHYVEGSMGLIVLSPHRAGSLMVYINRSRTDVLRGWFTGLKRSLIRSRARSFTEKQLASVKKKLEASHGEVYPQP